MFIYNRLCQQDVTISTVMFIYNRSCQQDVTISTVMFIYNRLRQISTAMRSQFEGAEETKR